MFEKNFSRTFVLFFPTKNSSRFDIDRSSEFETPSQSEFWMYCLISVSQRERERVSDSDRLFEMQKCLLFIYDIDFFCVGIMSWKMKTNFVKKRKIVSTIWIFEMFWYEVELIINDHQYRIHRSNQGKRVRIIIISSDKIFESILWHSICSTLQSFLSLELVWFGLVWFGLVWFCLSLELEFSFFKIKVNETMSI
jgi:hypothetical protein